MDRPDGVPDLRSAREMAAVFGMKQVSWRFLARRRRLPHYKVGTSIRWDVNECLRLCRREGEDRR